MKNSLLIAVVLLFSKSILSQCTISGLSATYCANSPTSGLTMSPSGGTLTQSGNGIINSVFSPSIAGIGTHAVGYSYCSSSYSLESLTYTQIPYSPTYITLGDNQMSAQLPIGFTFRFFCTDFTSFYISSNGFITFSPTQSSGCCQGLALPATGVDNIIACAWTDLDPSQGGTIRYCLLGTAPNRALLVSFNCIFHKTNQAPVTSEIWLYESSNAIEISTVTKPIPTGTVQYNTTMGMQGGNNQYFVVPGRNGTSNWTASSELYRFTPGLNCSFNQTVTVAPNPIITATSSKSLVCVGENVVLSASGGSIYLWNNILSGQSVVESPTVATTYTVVGTDSLGCSNVSTVNIKVSGCSGIEEESTYENNPFKTFPNPSTGNITLQSHSSLTIDIYNELGQKMKEFNLSALNNYQGSVLDLAPGVYFAVAQKNSARVTQKIIVVN